MSDLCCKPDWDKPHEGASVVMETKVSYFLARGSMMMPSAVGIAVIMTTVVVTVVMAIAPIAKA
jgi:hypothetical protein